MSVRPTRQHLRLVQHWLNTLLALQPPLKMTGIFDDPTKSAIQRFKQFYGVRPTTADVDATTLAALGAELGWRANGGDLTEILANLFVDSMFGPLNLNKEVFFRNYFIQYGPLNEAGLSGLSQLLTFIDRDIMIDDIRWAAYMLATVRLESTWRGSLWTPIEEGGRGKGKTYGESIEVKTPDGSVRKNAYFGRGYVQLTWKDNYVKFDEALHLNGALVAYPEKALEPTIAYAIMSLGMREGGFRGYNRTGFGGHKLADYISGARRDYDNARNIIIGKHDKAGVIADYAKKFEALLRASAA